MCVEILENSLNGNGAFKQLLLYVKFLILGVNGPPDLGSACICLIELARKQQLLIQQALHRRQRRPNLINSLRWSELERDGSGRDSES